MTSASVNVPFSDNAIGSFALFGTTPPSDMVALERKGVPGAMVKSRFYVIRSGLTVVPRQFTYIWFGDLDAVFMLTVHQVSSRSDVAKTRNIHA